LTFLLFAISAPAGSNHLEYWRSEKGLRFEIIDGYMKKLVTDIMYDRRNPLPGGIFAISFSFDCVDFEGHELGCGIYCDNQWGGNRDEQYYFIPLRYEIIGENHFRLFQDDGRNVLTNKNAPLEWVNTSDKMCALVAELCNAKGWYIRRDGKGFMGMSRWIFVRGDSPQDKALYYNQIS
jgi:hypothetical protein